MLTAPSQFTLCKLLTQEGSLQFLLCVFAFHSCQAVISVLLQFMFLEYVLGIKHAFPVSGRTGARQGFPINEMQHFHTLLPLT